MNETKTEKFLHEVQMLCLKYGVYLSVSADAPCLFENDDTPLASDIGVGVGWLFYFDEVKKEVVGK
jgi:hypothetical protein